MSDPHTQKIEHEQAAGLPAEGEPGAEARPARPVTGDAGVDRVLEQLDRQLDRPDDDPEGSRDEPDVQARRQREVAAEQVEAVTEAHRQLQARLSTPTPPAPPGQARPGPR